MKWRASDYLGHVAHCHMWPFEHKQHIMLTLLQISGCLKFRLNLLFRAIFITILVYFHQTLTWISKGEHLLRSNTKTHKDIQSRGQVIQSNSVIVRSDIIQYCINNCRNWSRISIRWWTHIKHPIPHHNGWALGCLLWIFMRKLTVL